MKSFLSLASMFLVLASAGANDLKVGLVLDKGGKDDKSFNAAAYKGAVEAREKLKITMKEVEATDDNAYETLLKSLANKKFDLIIAVGIAQAEAVKKVSAQYPGTKFAIVDADVASPNVRSLLFQEHEGSYLMGAIAAMTSKTGKIGFIGGMDIPLIRRFEMGYKAGAEKVNPKVKLVSNFVGVTSDSWNNPPKAKELALAQYDGGADVIFSAAGASGNGLFDAAEEKKKFAIGVDSNQNWIKPGYILTSMLKRVDQAVYKVIEETKSGKFTGGTERFGLQNSGIDYAMDQYNDKLVSEEVRKKVNSLKTDIIAGKIQVPDFYKTKKN